MTPLFSEGVSLLPGTLERVNTKGASGLALFSWTVGLEISPTAGLSGYQRDIASKII
jgi:hypothetical protein